MRKLRIFISSTMDDMQEERAAIVEAINQYSSWEAVCAENIGARPESPKEVCLEEVRNCEIYIGILKTICGHIPKINNPLKKFVVEMEYDEAYNNGLRILIFVYGNSTDREKRLADFIGKVSDFDTGHWREEYSDTQELVNCIINAINIELSRGYLDRNLFKRERKSREIFSHKYYDRFREN